MEMEKCKNLCEEGKYCEQHGPVRYIKSEDKSKIEKSYTTIRMCLRNKNIKASPHGTITWLPQGTKYY